MGHGNCALIRSEDAIAVVDGGRDETLVAMLRDEFVEHLDAVFVSHSDMDHVHGLTLALRALPDLTVGSVFVNPAQHKTTNAWRYFVEHVEARKRKHGTYLGPLLADDGFGSIRLCESSTIEVINPAYEDILIGMDVNTTSAVLKLMVDEVPEALFTGDLDFKGLRRMLERAYDPRARVLVFPHHGGGPGGNSRTFAEQISTVVGPEVTLVSLARNMFSNPQPEIVEGIRVVSENIHVACTQLSMNCSEMLPTTAIGGVERSSDECAGSITFVRRDNGTWRSEPDLEIHSRFVRSEVPFGLCVRRL